MIASTVGLVCMGTFFTSCQSSVGAEREDRRNDVSNREWSVFIQSSGGIAGRGQGSIEIRSSGFVEIATISGEVCRETLDIALIRDLDAAIDVAEPENWRGEYVLEHGADMFHYTLELELGENERELVEWNDGGELPDDLRNVWDSIRVVRDTVDCPNPVN